MSGLSQGLSQFQFHKGTIKTIEFTAALAGILKFQFHKGTIKTVPPLLRQLRAQLFQFHKGTIKTERGYDENGNVTDISIP